MKRLEQLEKLMADHAHWAGEVAKLKNLGGDAHSRCHGIDTADDGFGGIYGFGEHCLTKCAEEYKAMEQEPYNSISFEEFYSDAVAEEKVCEECQKVRKYKAERMNARRRLGQVRSAITRIGQSINKAKGGDL